MRRYRAIVFAIVAVAVVFAAIGCGSSAQPAAGDQTPQAIMAGAVLASQNIKSSEAAFDVTVDIKADDSQVPAEMKDLLSKPIKLSGTIALAEGLSAGEGTFSLQLAGQTLDAAFKGVGDNAWLQFGGQWYELPADTTGAESTTSTSVPSAAEMMKLLSDLGIDPTTWLKDLTVVGEEQVDGVATYHLKGTPDVAKMVSDGLQLLKSDEFQKLMSSGAGELGGIESMLPSPDELQKQQNELTQMFNNFSVEAWVGKADSYVRKASISAKITPPAGQATDGLNSVEMNVTVTLKNINQPVTVQAPTSSQPISELEKAITTNPQLLGPLGGLFGALMSSGFGAGGLGTETSTTVQSQ